MPQVKHQYRYTTDGIAATPGYVFESVWQFESAPEFVASDAAEWEYDHNDGWEIGQECWPREFVIWPIEGTKPLGKFSIEREFEPSFTASEVQMSSARDI